MVPFSEEQPGLWVGSHKTMGLVVYDKHAQVNLPSNRVRLFVVAERRMATFDRDSVRTRLSSRPCGSEDALTVYKRLRSRSRSTDCYECQRDLNAVDFRVCQRCGWICCECGACGCGYHGAPR